MFDADLATALDGSLTGGAAVFFNVTDGNNAGKTFLVVDSNGVDGYQAGQDLVLLTAEPLDVIPPLQIFV